MQNHPKRTTPWKNLSQKIARQPHSFPQPNDLLTISSVLFLCPQLIFLASAGFKEASVPKKIKKIKKNKKEPPQLFNKILGNRRAAYQRKPLVFLSRFPFPGAGAPSAALPARRSRPLHPGAAPRVPGSRGRRVRPPAHSPGRAPGLHQPLYRLLTHQDYIVDGVGLVFPSHLHIPIYKGYLRPSLSKGGRRGRWKQSLTLFLHLPFLLRFLAAFLKRTRDSSSLQST